MFKRDHPLSNRATGFNANLAPKYIGPLEVRRIISPVIFDLRNVGGKWYKHVHVKDLKPVPRDKHQLVNNATDRDTNIDVNSGDENFR